MMTNRGWGSTATLYGTAKKVGSVAVRKVQRPQAVELKGKLGKVVRGKIFLSGVQFKSVLHEPRVIADRPDDRMHGGEVEALLLGRDILAFEQFTDDPQSIGAVAVGD